MSRFRPLVALLAFSLVACADPAGAPAGGSALEIADVVFTSRNITAAEQVGVTFKVRRPGSGKLVAYGLSTRLGTARFPIETAVPVIADGAVHLLAVGPLPNQREAGKIAVAFWVEDELGASSNEATTELNVQ
jgi:hypothetical protein